MDIQKHFRRKRLKNRCKSHSKIAASLFSFFIVWSISKYIDEYQVDSLNTVVRLNLIHQRSFVYKLEPISEVMEFVNQHIANAQAKPSKEKPQINITVLINVLRHYKELAIGNIMSVFEDSFDIINMKVILVMMRITGRNKIIHTTQSHNNGYRALNDHLKSYQSHLHIAKSPGSRLKPSKFMIALSVVMMMASGSAVASSSAVSDGDINKFKVIHALNNLGQSVLLTVYQYMKPYPNSTNIKEHLITELHMAEDTFRNSFDESMIQEIENSSASGETYNIALLIKCLRVLGEQYERNNAKKWKDESKLECKCQKLANMRNEAFHNFDGLNQSEMKDQIKLVRILVKDIFSSLKKRFPFKSAEISKAYKDIDQKMIGISTQPIGLEQLSNYRCATVLWDEMQSYKNSCKSWGEIKMLEFHAEFKVLLNFKLVFTEVIIEKSNRFNKDTAVDYRNIINLASDSNLVLLDSERGGGRDAIIQHILLDWSEGGRDMNTTHYKLVLPMYFSNEYIKSAADLIGRLMPKVQYKMSNNDINKSITDPTLSILFLCIGYDERNPGSIALFQDILSLKEKYNHMKVIVTSRSDAVQDLFNTAGSRQTIEHLKVKGIHERNRPTFLKRYHDELVSIGKSKESTEDLVAFYENSSVCHKDLYRLPLNLVVLSWLWGQNPEKAKTIKSPAGLYSVIYDVSKSKLWKRLLFNPEFRKIIAIMIDNLKILIQEFEETLFNAALAALKFNRLSIDQTVVDSLMKMCKDNRLPFMEMQGAYLITHLQWEIKLEETLRFPHLGMAQFYAAKSIEFKIINEGKRVKDILLEHYENDQSKFEIYKYQQVIMLLGGILALKDHDLVLKHGQDIINLLIETGIGSNTQWFSVFSNVNVNPSSAETFAYMISPHLDTANFIVEDKYVDTISTLLEYIDIDTVTLDIRTTTRSSKLPILLDVLQSKNCLIKIPNVTDEQINLWNSSITQNSRIHIEKVMVTNNQSNLSFLKYCAYIGDCRLQHLWREPERTVPEMSQCKAKSLFTAFYRLEDLPTTAESLSLSILVDPATGETLHSGLPNIQNRCPQLKYIAVHVRAETPIDNLSHLPDVRCNDSFAETRTGTHLYLSELSHERHLQWSVDVARTLQPTRIGYGSLVLPQCHLNVEQLCELVSRLSKVGVTFGCHNLDGVYVSSPHTDQEKEKLTDTTRLSLSCNLYWYQSDDDLGHEGHW